TPTPRVAVVFAAAGAISRGVARAFAREGSTVWLARRDQDRTDAVAAELRGDHPEATVQAACVDATDAGAVGAFLDRVLAEAGRIDAVFNGIGGRPAELAYPKPIVETSVDDFLLPLARIAGSQFLTAREAGRRMAAQPGGGGAIVTLSATLSGMTGLLRLVPGPDDLLVRRLVEEHLYWIQVAFRWNHHPEAVRDAFFAPVPRAFRGLVFGLVRKQVRAALHAQGTGRRPEDEQLALAREDLTTLETVLGTRRFFGGDEPSVADASVHGLTSQLLATHLDDPLTQLAGTFSGLVAHHRRVEAAVYAEAPVRDAEAA
ncbi:MAG TPA: SDR family oxidoreductase, partial [Polyangiaceae bacterium LLY-WYZ-14_1]|nr:SDR family oxidoreductase [Polyangiaceae bacterium LLY-WYZ-14_1]